MFRRGSTPGQAKRLLALAVGRRGIAVLRMPVGHDTTPAVARRQSPSFLSSPWPRPRPRPRPRPSSHDTRIAVFYRRASRASLPLHPRRRRARRLARHGPAAVVAVAHCIAVLRAKEQPAATSACARKGRRTRRTCAAQMQEAGSRKHDARLWTHSGRTTLDAGVWPGWDSTSVLGTACAQNAGR